jgi:putative flavoprotein involved in K+ transport
VSYYLKLEGREHLVLEQAEQAANAWRNHRGDSFTLNTPNWQSQLAGAGMPGSNPNGFLTREEIVAYFERYIHNQRLPVVYGTRVRAVEADHSRGGYNVATSAGIFRARNVVVATGLYQKPRILRFGELSSSILQMHSDSYRNPNALPGGAVLVVGSAQSGAQIAEELYQSGRQVYLSVSSARRVPRRYRGKDINWWSDRLGLYDRTVDQLPSPGAKFGSKPHISGVKGGHTLNLHQFAADGVVLVGRMRGLEGTKAGFADDLHENLARADRFEANLVRKIDGFIDWNGLACPEEELPPLRVGFAQPQIDELDLRRADVHTVLWSTGYSFHFRMVKLPVFDADGYPIQRRGVTDYPGLYFVGGGRRARPLAFRPAAIQASDSARIAQAIGRLLLRPATQRLLSARTSSSRNILLAAAAASHEAAGRAPPTPPIQKQRTPPFVQWWSASMACNW